MGAARCMHGSMYVQNEDSNCHHVNWATHWRAGSIGVMSTFDNKRRCTVGVRDRGTVSLCPNKYLSI
jgi:hypothetical protein